MDMNIQTSIAAYRESGFVKFEGFFESTLLQNIEKTVLKFHHHWLKENESFYQTRAINSAFLTKPGILTGVERLQLFKLVANNELVELANEILGGSCQFMNTQLFFNPYNPEQKNYWHRDGQYHLNLEEQKQALQGAQVLHFRVPLRDEPGIEIVSGSHKHWDTVEEEQVRLERDGHHNFDDLSTGTKVPLKQGDLLIFNAMAIHRGLYGMDRLALDILYCDRDPQLLSIVDKEAMPCSSELTLLKNQEVFKLPCPC